MVGHTRFTHPTALHGSSPCLNCWLAAAGFVAVFLTLGVWLRISGQDLVWMQALHRSAHSAWEIWWWSSLTNLGLGWSFLMLVMASDRRHGSLIAMMLPTFLLGALLTHGLKSWLMVARPAASEFSAFFFIIGAPLQSGNSTPSGHALTAAACAALLIWWWRHWSVSILLLTAGLVVGGSRAIVAAHWPADVFLGLALGVVVVAMVRLGSLLPAVSRWMSRFKDRVASSHGQVVLAGCEMVCALCLWFTDTGYPEGWPSIVALVALSATSAILRLKRVMSMRQASSEHRSQA